MTDRVRIIDGDGHIQEDSQGIVAFLPDPYREMALETPRSVGLVPPVVGLFPPLAEAPKGRERKRAYCERALRAADAWLGRPHTLPEPREAA